MLRILFFSVLVLHLTACGMMRHRQPNNDETKVTLKDDKGASKEAPAAPTTSDPKGITPVKPDDYEAAQAEATEIKTAVAAAAEQIHATHNEARREAGSVSAEKSLGWLRNGNTRFVKGKFRNDGVSATDRARLMQGQRPHAVVVSCSDSRMPPEIIFDQKLGEIYVVRTASDRLDDMIVRSAEVGVSQLGSNLVVLLGNEGCGLSQDAANQLLERSAILRDGVASGEVKIVQAFYNLEAGTVEFK